MRLVLFSRFSFLQIFPSLSKNQIGFPIFTLNSLNKNLKIFIFSGAKDPVSNFGKSVNKLYKKYQKAGLSVSKKLYEDLRHESLNENERYEIYNDVLNFFKS